MQLYENDADGRKRRHSHPVRDDMDRRTFLSMAGKGLSLAALASASIGGAWDELHAATRRVADLSPEDTARDEGYWTAIQNAFDGNRKTLNLNNGGVSPSPRVVMDALFQYERQQEDIPSVTMWRAMEPQVETVRTGLATFFGCSPQEIAITRNATESLNNLLFGIDLRPGDEVLTSTQDYPRMLSALRQRQLRDGIVLRQIRYPVPVERPDDIVSAFEAGITPRTRVILVSHMMYTTGQISPVRAICDLGRSKGIEVIVDGAHSFAHMMFKRDDIGCDFFGASLHKWFCAPKGTGMLYIRKDRISSVWPLLASDDPRGDDIRKFESVGTHSVAPRLAVGDALRFHNEIGGARKEARLRFLREYWMERLSPLPGLRFLVRREPEHSCGIASFEIAGLNPLTIVDKLFTKHRILATTMISDQFKSVRVTPHVYTRLDELDRFSEAVATIVRARQPR